MNESTAGVESLVRQRLRALRIALGLSLDQLGERANLGASTISRVETGRRAISLDVLVPLAKALQVDLDQLLAMGDDDDIVIRPRPSRACGRTTWLLSRPESTTVAVKMRIQPTAVTPEQQVHPGHEWLYVLEGRLFLWLADRRITVEAGEAAEFTTMTPHAVTALADPTEVLMILDRDGQRAHVHQ